MKWTAFSEQDTLTCHGKIVDAFQWVFAVHRVTLYYCH